MFQSELFFQKSCNFVTFGLHVTIKTYKLRVIGVIRYQIEIKIILCYKIGRACEVYREIEDFVCLEKLIFVK